jgi:hypothetical protein
MQMVMHCKLKRYIIQRNAATNTICITDLKWSLTNEKLRTLLVLADFLECDRSRTVTPGSVGHKA